MHTRAHTYPPNLEAVTWTEENKPLQEVTAKKLGYNCRNTKYNEGHKQK